MVMRGAMMGCSYVLVVALVMMISHGGEGRWGVEAQQQVVHHVIGGDRGWDPSSDVASWSNGKVFKVGDNIWFAYSAAQEIVAELRSKEEFESCDVSNPIKMYTDGLNRVSLDGEGSRYFASGTQENCKNGLKLHVQVQSQHEQPGKLIPVTVKAVAPAGPIPSATSALPSQLSTLFLIGVALHLYYLAF